MPTTTPVTASRYNALRVSVNRVLGESLVSDPTYGYGETFSSSSVTGNYDAVGEAADKVSAEQYEELYFDLIRARIHQVGTAGVSVIPYPEGGFSTNQNADIIEESYIESLELLAGNLETDRFVLDSSQATAETLRNSTGIAISSMYDQSVRGTWNNSLTHIFDVSFQSAASRRHFFNAGGEIRVAASNNYAGAQFKSVAWRTAINGMGVTSITAERTFNNNSVGAGTSSGNYDLIGSYRLLYRLPTGSGGTYSSNFYEITGLALNESTVRIRVQFIDGRPDNTRYGIDENVFGDFFSNVSVLVPDGTAIINGVSTDTVVYSDPIIGTTISLL